MAVQRFWYSSGPTKYLHTSATAVRAIFIYINPSNCSHYSVLRVSCWQRERLNVIKLHLCVDLISATGAKCLWRNLHTLCYHLSFKLELKKVV